MACYGPYARPVRRYNAFPHFPVADLTPLFRLFDEELSSAVSRPLRSWQPRFDVREEKDAFQLHGELPGVDSKDIQIEFADDSTMIVRGRTVRERSEGSKPEAVQAAAEPQTVEEKITNDDVNDAASDAGSTSSSYKKPTVEDEEDFVDVNSENEKPAATPATAASEVTKPEPQQQQPQQPEKKTPEHKYWVSERSVGEFHRSFTFPGHVNQDAVTASLNNGILSVVVPKALPRQPRKISIQ